MRDLHDRDTYVNDEVRKRVRRFVEDDRKRATILSDLCIALKSDLPPEPEPLRYVDAGYL